MYEQPQACAYAICLKKGNFPIGYSKVDTKEHFGIRELLQKQEKLL